MRTTTLCCPEHPACIAKLVMDPDIVEHALAAPEWAAEWALHQTGALVAISHIEAELGPSGLLPWVPPEPDPEPEPSLWRRLTGRR